MRKFLFFSMFVLAVFLGSYAHAENATVTVTNNSEWAIDQFYLSPVGENSWGPDQLRDAVIGNGEHFELSGIPCGSFDVRLVDEDGDECVVGGANICEDNQGWIINSDDLLTCQKATEEHSEEESDDDSDR